MHPRAILLSTVLPNVSSSCVCCTAPCTSTAYFSRTQAVNPQTVVDSHPTCDCLQTRLHVVNLIDQLFQRSRAFRAQLTANFTDFLELSLGFRHERPLPGPASIASQLRDRALEVVEHWNDKFGSTYKQVCYTHSWHLGLAALQIACLFCVLLFWTKVPGKVPRCAYAELSNTLATSHDLKISEVAQNYSAYLDYAASKCKCSGTS